MFYIAVFVDFGRVQFLYANFSISIVRGRAFTSSEVIANISNYFNVEPSLLFKSDFIEHTDKEVNLKKEINRLLSDCCHEMLEKIYNIIIALKK